jgi:hypothetical protein
MPTGAVASDIDLPLSRVQHSGDDLEQGGLACAIGSHDSDPLAGHKPKGDVLQDRAAVIVQRYLARLDYRCIHIVLSWSFHKR